MELKQGDMVVLNSASLGWFPVGSTLTYVSGYDDITGRFTGLAREDGVGGLKCKAGDTISGYARIKDVTPVAFIAQITTEEFVSVTTTIVIPRKLTAEETAAIHAIIGVGK